MSSEDQDVKSLESLARGLCDRHAFSSLIVTGCFISWRLLERPGPKPTFAPG